MNDEDNSLINNSVEETPLYERPGVLDPDRNIPINRKSDEYANVHYDNEKKGYLKDSDSPEFTENSVNAMNPFEDSELLSGFIRPKSTGVKTGAKKVESKIFTPETDMEPVRKKVKKTLPQEEPQPVYVAEEDAAASTDYIADAMSGVDTVEKKADDSDMTEASTLKMLVYLLAVVITVEIAGIAFLILL